MYMINKAVMTEIVFVVYNNLVNLNEMLPKFRRILNVI